MLHPRLLALALVSTCVAACPAPPDDDDGDDAGEGDAGEGDAGEGDAGEGDADEGDAGEGDAGEGEGDAGEGDAGEGDAGEGDLEGAFPAAHFDAELALDAGRDPSTIDVGDVDEDGDLDIAIGGFNDARLLLQHADGSFAPLVVALEGVAFGLDMGDVDGDGHLDIVAGFSGGDDDSVHVLFGDGVGGLTDVGVEASGGTPHLADRDADGDLDIAIVDFGALAWLDNDGARGFSFAEQVDLPEGELETIVGDFTGDDRADIVSGTGTGIVVDDGVQQRSIPTATGAVDVALANIDGDAAADLVAAGNGAEDVYVLLDGESAVTTYVAIGADFFVFARRLVVGDLDADGDDDVITGDGGFPVSALFENVGGELVASAIEAAPGLDDGVLADIDDDGDVDLALIDLFGGAARVVRAAGAGQLPPEPPGQLAAAFAGAVAIGNVDDTDGAGRADVLVASNEGVVVGTQAADGALTRSLPIAGAASAVAAADLDDDGDDDVAHVDGNGIVRLSEAGDGALTPRGVVDVVAERVVFGDLDGDGENDVISLVNQDLSWSRGLGDFSFAAPVTAPAPQTFSVVAGPVVVGGAIALCVPEGFGGAVHVAELAGDELERRQLPIPGFADRCGIGDIDGDGDADIVVGQINDEFLTVYLNDDDELTFSAELPFAGAGPATLAVGDIDGDGDADIAMLTEAGQLVAWRNGVSFSAPTTWFVPFASDLVLADLNGDGALDALLSRREKSDVRVLVAAPPGG